MKLRWQVGLLLALVVLVYANSLFNDFTFDDDLYIRRNVQVTHPTVRSLFEPNAVSNVYRPVTFGTLALNWMAAGYRPLGYHLFNLLLHALVVLLVLFLMRNLMEGLPNSELVSFATAVLFAVHPLHTEAVSSIVGRSELLAAAFLLTAWLLHLRDHWGLSLLSFALALLSKESAIGLLPLALAGDYAKGKLKSWTRYAAIAATTLLYIGALWRAQGGHFGPSVVAVLDNPLVLLATHLRVLNAVRIFWKYVALLVFPITLSCDYSFNQIYLFEDVRHLLFPAAAAIGLSSAWVWAIWKRHGGYIIAGAIFFAGFAVTSNIFTPTGTIFGERLAYLPSAGFCLLAALTADFLARRHRMISFLLLTFVAVAFSVRTVVRNRDWHDNRSLYFAAVEAVPNSAKMRTFRGYIYMDQNRFDLARQDLQVALRLYPEYPDAVEGMGLVEARSGNTAAALPLLQKALDMSDRRDPFYDFRAVNLAALQMQTGRFDEALRLLTREIAESPDYSRSWSNRAVLHLKLGQLSAAREDANAALRIDPANAQARGVLDWRPGAGLP